MRDHCFNAPGPSKVRSPRPVLSDYLVCSGFAAKPICWPFGLTGGSGGSGELRFRRSIFRRGRLRVVHPSSLVRGPASDLRRGGRRSGYRNTALKNVQNAVSTQLSACSRSRPRFSVVSVANDR